MSTNIEEMVKDFHKKFAEECFNKTWDLIDKKSRTHEEDLEMIHLAHASRYHWGEIGDAVNFERGEWQIARVYSELSMFDSSILHGKRCLDICLENEIGDFDLAFAYEGLVRAYKLTSEKAEYKKYKALALEAADDIKDSEDKKYFMSEIENL